MKLARKNIPLQLSSFSNLIEEDLDMMDDLIKSLTINRQELIFLMSDYLFSSFGKRLRPILTIICSKIFSNYPSKRQVGLAAAVEFIHTATLLHDDVVDNSKLRRGKKTANSNWGNKESILVGDFLLSQAFRLMVKDGSLEILDVLSNAASVLSEGEVLQIVSIHNIDLTINDYMQIISSKTAKLFEAACQVGAIIAECSEIQKQSLKDFGNLLGIAFQIIDDVLDYSAKEDELGKNIGDDFREGKVTLPIILAYNQANEFEKSFFKKTICELKQDEYDLKKVIELLNKYNALSESIEIARKYISEAKEKLKIFDQSDAKNALLKILEFSLARTY